MKSLAILFYSLIGINLYSAEIRTPDYIKYKGQTLTISNSPMELYFELYPELVPKPDIFWIHTNKNYSAVYELKDSVLYLIEINIERLTNDSSYNKVNVISEIFEGQSRVEMDWLSTILIIEPESFQKGKYEIIHFDKGKLRSTKMAKLKQVKKLKHNLFEEFTHTDEFLQIKKQHSDWTNESIEQIVVRDKILEYSSQIDNNKTPHNTK
ncbi:hypothetical protein N9W70_05190 [Schleiferiaceae bacterium]|nr:hypothetical protein [Schleiferiaceae bacterium]